MKQSFINIYFFIGSYRTLFKTYNTIKKFLHDKYLLIKTFKKYENKINRNRYRSVNINRLEEKYYSQNNNLIKRKINYQNKYIET